jgi:hypothetical protein
MTLPAEPDAEVARKNVVLAWALAAIFLLLCAGAVTVVLIWNAVSAY